MRAYTLVCTTSSTTSFLPPRESETLSVNNREQDEFSLYNKRITRGIVLTWQMFIISQEILKNERVIKLKKIYCLYIWLVLQKEKYGVLIILRLLSSVSSYTRGGNGGHTRVNFIAHYARERYWNVRGFDNFCVAKRELVTHIMRLRA